MCDIKHGSGSSWCNQCGGQWDYGDDFPCPDNKDDLVECIIPAVDVGLSFGLLDVLVLAIIAAIIVFGNPWVGAGCIVTWLVWFGLRGVPDAPPGK